MKPRESELTVPYLTKIRALAPLIDAHRAAFDTDRRLPPAVFGALADAGLFRLWLPKTLGGPGLSMIDFVDVIEAAAELDPSVGWIVGNGAGMSRAAGYLSESVSREWFSDPRAFIVAATGAIGTAAPVAGGFQVSGRWPFGSGVHNASWAMGLCAQPNPVDPACPQLICCYVPAQQIKVIDNWHVSGLRGTGSCDFEINDRFVPLKHSHPLVQPVPTQPGQVYRLPNISVFAVTVSAVPLGIVRAALTEFVALASRVRLGTTLALRDREVIQSELGRVQALYRSARALFVEALNELAAAFEEGGQRLINARALLRVACSLVAENCTRAIDSLATMAGSAAIFETGRLERYLRDVHAATKHIAMSPNNYVLAGRLSLGLEPVTARF